MHMIDCELFLFQKQKVCIPSDRPLQPGTTSTVSSADGTKYKIIVVKSAPPPTVAAASHTNSTNPLLSKPLSAAAAAASVSNGEQDSFSVRQTMNAKQNSRDSSHNSPCSISSVTTGSHVTVHTPRSLSPSSVKGIESASEREQMQGQSVASSPYSDHAYSKTESPRLNIRSPSLSLPVENTEFTPRSQSPASVISASVSHIETVATNHGSCNRSPAERKSRPHTSSSAYLSDETNRRTADQANGRFHRSVSPAISISSPHSSPKKPSTSLTTPVSFIKPKSSPQQNKSRPPKQHLAKILSSSPQTVGAVFIPSKKAMSNCKVQMPPKFEGPLDQVVKVKQVNSRGRTINTPSRFLE